jgi:predicted ester cyclase
MVQENICAVQEAVACFNDLNARHGYFDLYAPDCVIHGLPPGLPPDLTGLQTFYRTVWSAFPDITITLEEVFGERDALAVRFEARGMQEGEFLGMPASGRLTTFFVLCLLHFSNRRVVERWAHLSLVE